MDDGQVIGDWELTTFEGRAVRADTWSPDRDATLTVACIDAIVKVRATSPSHGNAAVVPRLDDLSKGSTLRVDWTDGSGFSATFGTAGATEVVGLLEQGCVTPDRTYTYRDDNAIVAMVTEVVARELPKVRAACYEPRRAEDPSVAGQWLLTWVIAPSGKVEDARAVASEGTRADPVLEVCLAREVGAWTFSPIKAALPVQKTVGLKPAP